MSEVRGSMRAVDAARVFRVALVVGSVVAGALLLWQLADVLLLVFAAILVAIALRALSGFLERHSPLGRRIALTLTILSVLVLLAGFFYLVGAQIRTQLAELLQSFPSAVSSLGERVGVEDLDQQLVENVEQFSARSGVLSRVASYTGSLLAAVGGFVLVIVAGVFLASHPETYRHGALLLVPRRIRAEAARLLDNLAHALRRWLLGQLISMLLVGTITTAGLYLIGLPSALALGFLAGLAEFVPVIGPVVAFLPAAFLAVPEGGTTVLLVIALYIVVQQVESNMIMPLVQRRVVDLPPVVTLFTVVAFGVLFGPLGVLLATPLTVVAFVAVKQLYVRDTLHEPTRIPGEAERN